MPKFEYRILQVDALSGERVTLLNNLGESGWELVSYTTPFESPSRPGYWYIDMVFKRKKEITMIKIHDGVSYSLKPFEGYTHRYKVEIDKSTYFNGPYAIDIYTDTPDKEEVLRTLNKSDFVSRNPGSVITIVRTTTRQEEDAVSELIDEFFKND